MAQSSRTRPPVKQDEVYAYVHSSIVDGELAPGERLPARLVYEEQFGVSSVTVQRAFDRLMRDGFIEVKGTAGTFVSAKPPHLHRYALVFPDSQEGKSWSTWFSVLLDTAAHMRRLGVLDVRTYLEANDHVKSAGVRELLADVRDSRLAGAVLIGHPQLSRDILERIASAVPTVVLGSSPKVPPVAQLACVDLGGVSGFLRRALEYLAKKGRKRVAMTAVSMLEPERQEYFYSQAETLGMKTDSAWVHGIDPYNGNWGENIARLLFSKNQSERPDALIISDDNLVDQVCRGLLGAGVSVPADVEIVAHCNFPNESYGVLPLARLGFDTRTALATCIELIDARNSGREWPLFTHMDAIFEWEVATS